MDEVAIRMQCIELTCGLAQKNIIEVYSVVSEATRYSEFILNGGKPAKQTQNDDEIPI